MESCPGGGWPATHADFCPSWLLLPPHPVKELKEAPTAGQDSQHSSMAYIAKSFYDLSAIGLDGEKIDFNTFRGRAVLIENVASL